MGVKGIASLSPTTRPRHSFTQDKQDCAQAPGTDKRQRLLGLPPRHRGVPTSGSKHLILINWLLSAQADSRPFTHIIT